ncbi:hypothetical protein B296_00020855 [Ensete ventricosum]|uniref:Uncharacterized protein n=1 Tax=Ensete ventricosum TaxID=4639 RepID=A0A426ZH02_ENSVE|nr:hypothetical protein B296_00020855 [Ensete ventricosum]
MADKETAIEVPSEWIRVNEAVAEASLAADGTLRWGSREGERCLSLESEVLGLETNGLRITIKAFVEASEHGFCGLERSAVKRRRVRTDYTLEMPNEAAARRWSAHLRDYMDSLGTGNGMVKSLLDPAGDLCSIPNATFAVIRVFTVSREETNPWKRAVKQLNTTETQYFFLRMLPK